MTVSTANVGNVPRRCSATNRRGQPCQAYAGESGLCFWHDPARAKARAKARARGGHARHGRQIGATGAGSPVPVQSMTDVVALLEAEIGAMLTLEKSLGRGGTIARLAGVIIKALEFATLEERVAALERREAERDETRRANRET